MKTIRSSSWSRASHWQLQQGQELKSRVASICLSPLALFRREQRSQCVWLHRGWLFTPILSPSFALITAIAMANEWGAKQLKEHLLLIFSEHRTQELIPSEEDAYVFQGEDWRPSFAASEEVWRWQLFAEEKGYAIFMINWFRFARNYHIFLICDINPN